jgi:UDP:flavonoid glycosyltransferase YjiC (YdhE family)
LLRAPRFPGEITGLPEPQLAYSEMIMRYGYLAPEMLLPQLRAWRQIIQDAAPDLVITDHAPTALLAARSLGLVTARIGTGFCCPPVEDPEPPLMSWRRADAARAAESAHIVLAAINGALEAVGAPPLAALSQMHRADEDFVTTYAGLDHYAQRATPRWGVILGAEGGDTPQWPTGRGPRVFAYLKAGLPQTDVLLRALRRKQCTALIYCPGLSAAQRANFERAGLRFAERPLDIDAATASCDLVICGGGHGTVCAALLAGKPLLIAPYLTEQGITSHNVEALGAGLSALMGQEGHYGSLLTRLLMEPGFARAAQAFRAQHGAISQPQIVSAIADRCLELAQPA